MNKCVSLVVRELVGVKTRGNNKSCKLKQIQEIFVSQCQCCLRGNLRVSVPFAKASKAQQLGLGNPSGPSSGRKNAIGQSRLNQVGMLLDSEQARGQQREGFLV